MLNKVKPKSGEYFSVRNFLPCYGIKDKSPLLQWRIVKKFSFWIIPSVKFEIHVLVVPCTKERGNMLVTYPVHCKSRTLCTSETVNLCRWYSHFTPLPKCCSSMKPLSFEVRKPNEPCIVSMDYHYWLQLSQLWYYIKTMYILYTLEYSMCQRII